MRRWGIGLGLLLVAVCRPVEASSPAVRVIAVDARIDLSRMEAPDALAREVDRLMAMLAPQLAADRPNLVVFPEGWAAQSALGGADHAAARAARTAPEVWGTLQAAHLGEVSWLRTSRGLGTSQAMGQVLADRLYRPAIKAFSAAARQYHTAVIGCTLAPEVSGGLRLRQSLRSWNEVPVKAQGTELYSKAFCFDDAGRLVGALRRRAGSDPADPLAIDRGDPPTPFELPFGKVGVALGPDTADAGYLAALSDQGCQVVVMATAHPGGWAEPDARGRWKPQEWLTKMVAPLQATGAIRYVVAPVPKGLLGDLLFDGQGSIVARDGARLTGALVGTDPGGLTGRFMAIAPWVVPDPSEILHSKGPAMSLADRQLYLQKVSETLRVGRARSGQVREDVLAADLALAP